MEHTYQTKLPEELLEDAMSTEIVPVAPVVQEIPPSSPAVSAPSNVDGSRLPHAESSRINSTPTSSSSPTESSPSRHGPAPADPRRSDIATETEPHFEDTREEYVHLTPSLVQTVQVMYNWFARACREPPKPQTDIERVLYTLRLALRYVSLVDMFMLVIGLWFARVRWSYDVREGWSHDDRA